MQAKVDLLITDTRLVTLAGDAPSLTPVPNQAIAVHEGTIAWIGDTDDANRPDAHETLEGEGCLTTPGLVDCHTHLVYADPEGVRVREFEAKTQGATYKEIAKAGGGITATLHAAREADEDLLFETAARDLTGLMDTGTTTVEIKASYAGDLEGTLKELRVAQRLAEESPVIIHPTFCPQVVPPEFSDETAYAAYVCNEILPAIVDEELATAVDAFCEQPGVGLSPVAVRRILGTAKDLGLNVKAHADQLSDQGGAALVAELGGISADHLEYTSEAGVAAMAAAGTTAVLLPGAFYYLKETQRPPVEAFRRHGVPMAVATDCNPGSSPIVSPLLAMNMACLCFGLTVEEAFLGFTLHGARALGAQDHAGTIAVGQPGALAMWDADQVAELVYRGGANPLARVVMG